jgi:histidinol-phosphate aminotransferase
MNSVLNAQFISPVVQQLVPYVPGEQPKMANLVKLNTNENPYPPSPRVVAAIQQAAQHGLQLYPDPDGSTLRQAIARHLKLTPQQFFLGNGSDEVLAHAFFAFFQQGCPLLMPDISYSFYKVYCGLYSIAARTVPLREGLQLNVADYACAENQPVAGVVIANPNAPTGVGLSLADIETLLQMHPNRVVLVDEAYVDFGGHSAIALIDRHPNLLVVHTLSKSRSLAGLRIGYACGQTHLIEALNRVKNSFNSYPLDRLALAGGVAAFEDQAYFEQTCQAVMSSREGLTLALEDLGFEVLPSQTNFVFARHPEHAGAELAAGLRAQGVLVRHFKQARIDQYLRISVGTPEQCGQLVAALAKLVTAQA